MSVSQHASTVTYLATTTLATDSARVNRQKRICMPILPLRGMLYELVTESVQNISYWLVATPHSVVHSINMS